MKKEKSKSRDVSQKEKATRFDDLRKLVEVRTKLVTELNQIDRTITELMADVKFTRDN